MGSWSYNVFYYVLKYYYKDSKILSHNIIIFYLSQIPKNLK